MNFIGVVLAGGQSRRMGVDKALLTLNGETMLARTAKCLQQANAKEIIISRNGPSEQGISDKLVNKGPLSGIHAATLQKPADDLLIVPVDLPYLTHSTLLKLIENSQKHHCSSYFTGHNLPLYLANNSNNVQILKQVLLHSNDYSVGGFIRQIGAKDIQPPDTQDLLNTNHPDEWHKAKQEIQTKN